MAGVHTERGTACPVCGGREKTKYVALLPFKGKQPHTYSVGPNCYRKQWELSGEEGSCPVEPVEEIDPAIWDTPPETPPEAEPAPAVAEGEGTTEVVEPPAV